MLNIELSRCKYPNIIAEMEALDMDFSEMASVLHTTAREAKSMLVTGKKPVYLEDMERVRSFFRVPDMGILAKSELVTSQEGTTFKAVILGLKQEALHQLNEIEQHGVELDSWQKRAAEDIYRILEKAETSPLNYAEYRCFIDSGEKIERVYKDMNRKEEYRIIKAFVEEQPEEASKKLLEMFSIMHTADRAVLFSLAFRDKAVKTARKEQKQ